MNNLRTIKILNIVFLVITICMAVIFLKFIGESSSEDYLKSFSSYIKKEKINEILYEKSTQYLTVKRESVTVKVRNQFDLIDQIYIKNDILYFEKNNDLMLSWINDFTQGSKLKEELSKIKIIANKVEEVSINNKAKIESYYSKFYPYYVSFCDFSYNISLFDKGVKCPAGNNISLKINTLDKKYELGIDDYPDWSLIFTNYISFSDKKVEEEINKFKETAKEYNGKFYIENSGIVAIIDKNSILYSDGIKKKTIRNITSEVVVIKKDNKEYIEDLRDDTISYVKYENSDSFNEDIEYIMNNLIN
jgi:hypothetical protein